MKRLPASFGRMYGSVQTDWIENHPRNMWLLQNIEFVDRHGRTFFAAKGSTINGASTGWFLRRLFPAYVGFYRRASVLHDVHCERKVYPSWKVHRMFYEVSRHDIELMSCEIKNPLKRWLWTNWSIGKAWCMWMGVRVRGPRF